MLTTEAEIVNAQRQNLILIGHLNNSDGDLKLHATK